MEKKFKKYIKGKKIYLRLLKINDVNSEYLAWLNNKANNQYTHVSKSNLTMLKNYVVSKLNDPEVLFFAIIEKQTNKHIGNIKLEPINWLKKKAAFGRLIGRKKYKGKGYGSEAVKLLLKFCFKNLKLNKVVTSCSRKNIAAIKSNKKNGMKFEKKDKDIWVVTRFTDIICLGISKKNWKKINK